TRHHAIQPIKLENARVAAATTPSKRSSIQNFLRAAVRIGPKSDASEDALIVRVYYVSHARARPAIATPTARGVSQPGAACPAAPASAAAGPKNRIRPAAVE